MRIEELLENSRYVTIHRRLNPRLFKAEQMRPEVRRALLRIAENFREFLGVDIDLVDVTVTGSNAAYAYTVTSDLDLHLMVPGVASDREREFYDAKKSLWNEQHDVLIRGLPVEVYVQGSEEPHHSSGVYSLVRDQWRQRPQKQKPTIDDVSVSQRLRYFTREIQSALASRDRATVAGVKQRISLLRREGLNRTGEWSAENIAFKTLRSQGLLDSLTQHLRHLEDQALSLENQEALAL